MCNNNAIYIDEFHYYVARKHPQKTTELINEVNSTHLHQQHSESHNNNSISKYINQFSFQTIQRDSPSFRIISTISACAESEESKVFIQKRVSLGIEFDITLFAVRRIDACTITLPTCRPFIVSVPISPLKLCVTGFPCCPWRSRFL